VTSSTQLLFIGDKSFCVAVSSYMFRPVYQICHQAKHYKTILSKVHCIASYEVQCVVRSRTLEVFIYIYFIYLFYLFIYLL